MKQETIEEINHALKCIETEKNIEILWACESGSRAWGFESPDSDYDVRFIYKERLFRYLSLRPQKDTLDYQLPGDLDISGWDLKKSLNLIYKGNSSIFEWFASPIVYRFDPVFVSQMKPILLDFFDPRVILHHYLGLAKRYHQRVTKSHVRYKDYFYLLRAVLSALWISEQKTQPPLVFTDLLKSIEEPAIADLIHVLYQEKMKALESDTMPRSDLLNLWLNEKHEYVQEKALDINKKNLSIAALDQLFLNQLKVQ